MNEPNYNYLDLLNQQQRDAVVYKDGPSLVIAGAGSGKTRVLTYKIVDLLAAGYEPWRILALTFTNKAAREMKERVASVVGERVSSRLWMGTFHSIFLRVLRRHADKIGFSSSFTIYDAADSKSLIKSIIKDLGLDDKVYKPSTVMNVISNAKNSLITAEMFADDNSLMISEAKAGRTRMAEIYKIYARRCKAASAMDFDDILLYTNILLRDYPDILRHYQEYFQYILVDEYQDTNFAQHLVISRLVEVTGRICVVGDDAQSIYSFRGANIANILHLERTFKGLKTFKLERNYRSTQNIINAAGSLIKQNKHQLPKNVYSENEIGEKIYIIQTYSDLEEAGLVATKIAESRLNDHDAYDNYAILYRTNAQSRLFEESLRKRNIPYRIYGGVAFYQRKEVRDAISYFRLAINPDDDEALRRVINYPSRGIGQTTMKKLIEAAMDKEDSIFNILCDIDNVDIIINKGTRAKLLIFRDMIADFREYAKDHDAFETAQYIYAKTGILAVVLSDNTPESIARQENLTELMNGIRQFVDEKIESGEDGTDMVSYLSTVSLATDQDEDDENPEPKVTLMTVHASKGLEFDKIYIVGLEEELFPSALSMDKYEDIEEERRLLYVAMTRAKTRCTITYAGSRFRNGQTMYSRPSRFLKDIDRQYVKLISSSSYDTETGYTNPVRNYYSNQKYSFNTRPSGNRFSTANSSFAGSVKKPSATNFAIKKPSVSSPVSKFRGALHTAAELNEGMRIEHGKFGNGTIIEVIESGGEQIIRVEFDNLGEKKLMLRFAKFDIIS